MALSQFFCMLSKKFNKFFRHPADRNTRLSPVGRLAISVTRKKLQKEFRVILIQPFDERPQSVPFAVTIWFSLLEESPHHLPKICGLLASGALPSGASERRRVPPATLPLAWGSCPVWRSFSGGGRFSGGGFSSCHDDALSLHPS